MIISIPILLLMIKSFAPSLIGRQHTETRPLNSQHTETECGYCRFNRTQHWRSQNRQQMGNLNLLEVRKTNVICHKQGLPGPSCPNVGRCATLGGGGANIAGWHYANVALLHAGCLRCGRRKEAGLLLGRQGLGRRCRRRRRLTKPKGLRPRTGEGGYSPMLHAYRETDS